MLKLKLTYFGHLMQWPDSWEKTLMLAKIEGKRRRGRQRMRWLDSITNSVDMNLSKFQKITEDERAWPATVHGLQSPIWLSNWTTAKLKCTINVSYFILFRLTLLLQDFHYPLPWPGSLVGTLIASFLPRFLKWVSNTVRFYSHHVLEALSLLWFRSSLTHAVSSVITPTKFPYIVVNTPTLASPKATHIRYKAFCSSSRPILTWTHFACFLMSVSLPGPPEPSTLAFSTHFWEFSLFLVTHTFLFAF